MRAGIKKRYNKTGSDWTGFYFIKNILRLFIFWYNSITYEELMKLEDLGYNSFFEVERIRLGLGDFGVGRVVFESRGAYKVKNENGEFLAKITGKQMHEANSREDSPAVGDWVAITELDCEKAVIHAILPRKTIIKRKSGDKNRAGNKNDIQVIGTNIDVAFAVESIGRDYNLNRLERYFAIAKDGGAQPAIIINKTDLASREEMDLKMGELKQRFKDIPIIATSAANDAGLDELEKYITRGKTYCFLGSSGVGKSSLINALSGRGAARTSITSGFTHGLQKIMIGNQIMLLDTPGVFPYTKETEFKYVKTGALSFDRVKEPEVVLEKLIAEDKAYFSEEGPSTSSGQEKKLRTEVIRFRNPNKKIGVIFKRDYCSNFNSRFFYVKNRKCYFKWKCY